MSDKVLLMILDGWGLGKTPRNSAIAKAKTPFIDSCYTMFPNAKINTTGMAVGLPEGQMGNSEVGHINIGAGRVVYQNLVKINLAVENRELEQNTVLKNAFEYARSNKKKIHFIGLVSDGGVHSHINHLKALLTATSNAGIKKNVFIHAFTDGRDCDPKSGINFIRQIENHTENTTGEIASVMGRYYAMDRDKRWERVKKAYDAMVLGKGEQTKKITQSIQKSYENGTTDEFLEPIINSKVGNGNIEEKDVVICFNFRTDRGREITETLTQKNFPEYGMKTKNLRYITMTQYDETYKNVEVMFQNKALTNTLGEVLSKQEKKQIRIAETEKYPHVTFFFSGGNEKKFQKEKRILCPSPKEVATYDLKPEMSAYEIRDRILPELENQEADFICLNFANADMVGHTGVFEAAVKACEVVDSCAEKITETAIQNGYLVLIIADHGNADLMRNPDGSPHTQHTTNLVPLIVVDAKKKLQVQDGKLADLAPSILALMNLEIPDEMDGNIIIKK